MFNIEFQNIVFDTHFICLQSIQVYNIISVYSCVSTVSKNLTKNMSLNMSPREIFYFFFLLHIVP